MSDETNSRRALRAALLIAGAALFALLVWQIGPRAIAASFARLGPSLIIVLVFPHQELVEHAPDTATASHVS